MSRRVLSIAVLIAASVSAVLFMPGKKRYLDIPEAAWAAGQIPIITRQSVNDFGCISNPGNPPTGYVRLYCDSGTGNLTALNHSGGSAFPSGSSAFNAITSGTNTSAAMLVGSGASLGFTGTGILAANRIATNFGTNVIFTTDYGVKANTQWDNTATWTAGGAVTLSFAGVTSADAGKACTGITAGGANTLPTATITSVTDTSHFQCGSGSSSGSGVVAWGTDDTAAMQSAWNAMIAGTSAQGSAAPTCGGGFVMPQGMIWLTANPATQAGVPSSCGQFDTNFPLWNVRGAGRGTTILFLAPSFGWNSTSAGGCRFASLATTCLFFPTYTNTSDFTVTAMAYKPTVSAPASVLTIGTGSVLYNVAIINTGLGVANLHCMTLSGQGSTLFYPTIDGACGGSSDGIFVTALGATIVSGYDNGGLNVGSGAEVVDYGGFYNSGTLAVDSIAISGTMHMYDTRTNGTGVANTPACSLNTNAVLDIHGSTVSPNIGSCVTTSTGAGIFFRGNNATVYMRNATVTGGAGAFGGAINSNSKTGLKVYDFGGNTISGSMTNFAGTYLYGSEVAAITLTAQTATIGTTTLYAVPSNAAGTYRVCVNAQTTTAGTAGDTLVVTLGWNNGGAKTDATPTIDLATLNTEYPASGLGTDLNSGCLVLNSAASQNITYATTVAKTGTPQYALRITVENIGR